MLSAVGAEIRVILSRAWAYVCCHRRAYLTVWGGSLLLTPLLLALDPSWLQAVQAWSAGHEQLARTLSSIGRFENSSLLFAVGLAGAGLLLRRPQLKQAAVACLLAGLVAGVTVNVARPVFGRARPRAAVAPGFYWFETKAALHGMPSGHASSNVASATAIAAVSPVLGAPFLVYAAGVCWSRMALNQHYPADIWWGIVLGGSVGVAIGAAVRGRAAGSP